MKPKPLVVLDVETTGLDPKHHTLTAIGIGIEQMGRPMVYFVEQPYKERAAIRWLKRKLDRLGPHRVGSWRNFDVPFVRTRARIHRLPDPFERTSGFLDLQRFAVRKLKRDVHLSDAGRLLGLGEKLFASEDLPALYARWLGGDARAKQKIVEHCRRDIELEMGVYQRLKSITGVFKKGLSGPFAPMAPILGLQLRPTI